METNKIKIKMTVDVEIEVWREDDVLQYNVENVQLTHYEGTGNSKEMAIGPTYEELEKQLNELLKINKRAQALFFDAE